MGAWKPFVMGIAGVLVGFILLVGVAWAADIFTVDKDGTVRIVVTDGGKVGIGTASPTTTLNVLQTTNDGTDDILAQAASPGGQVILYHAGNATGRIRVGTTDAMTLTNTGRAGVGRTPTANALEVEGDASKTAAGNWLANSDARIKTDVRDIVGALETIERLRPVKFRYTDDYRAQHPSIENRDYENFIAQEFQRVFPECVKDDGTGLLQVDTYNVIPTLVAAAQELSRKNREMETKIRMLEEKTKGDNR